MPNDRGSETTVGTYLAARLVEAGIRHHFAVPGDFNLILLDELLKEPRLEMIGCCNELNAGYAADGYARANDAAALVLTFGVGGLSALNAVACAYAEDLPIVVLIGSVNSGYAREGRLIHHGLGEPRYDYQRRMYAEVTAGAFAIERADDAPGVIDRAIPLALRRRKPVMIEVACDVAARPCPSPWPIDVPTALPCDPVALRDAASHAASLLRDAARPVLVGGSKLRLPGGIAMFASLADASQLPVAVMPGGKGMFPEDHPNFVGLYWGPVGTPGVAALVEGSDLALFAGTILSDYATAGYATRLDPSRTILAMPDEIRMPGATYSGVPLADFLGAVAGRLRQNSPSRSAPPREAAVESPTAADPSAPLTIAEVARQVRGLLGPDTALLVETGDSWFHGLETRLPAGCAFEIQFQAGSIGWSVPATLGYELGLASPRRVITMVGDGSFQLTAQEVSTMIRRGTRPILVLVNNRGYVIEDAIHKGPYNSIKNWDYAGLMAVFNGDDGRGLGLRAGTSGELDVSLSTALDHDGPCLIEVAIAPDDCSPTLRDWGRRVAEANARHDGP